MPSRTSSYLSTALGGLLVLAGMIPSASTWIGWLRDTAAVPADLMASLLLGALLFKGTLVVAGLVVLVLGRLRLGSAHADPSVSPPHHDTMHLAMLTVLLVTALILRLYRLGDGLWHDEIATYINYGHLSVGELITTYDSQNQHFLFSLLARASLTLFGEGAWALRLPAVLFGVGSIWAMYLLGREVGTVREALLSAALMAFAYHHVWFSQNARGYSGLLFWTLLTSWFLVRGLRGAPPKIWLGYAVTAALGVYTQLAMLFVIAGHFVIYLLHQVRQHRKARPVRWAGLFLGFGLAGLCTLLLYALVVPQFLADFTGRTQATTFSTWQNPLWTLFEIVRAMHIGFAGGSVGLAGLVVFGIGLRSWIRTNSLVVQLLFITTAICALAAVATGHNLWPRLFFFAMGFGILVVIRGLLVLGDWLARRLRLPAPLATRLGITLSLGLILLSALSVLFVYGPKQDYQGALAFVEANRQPGDLVVTTGMAAFTFREYYRQNWPSIESAEVLYDLRKQARRTWLIYAFRPHMEALHRDVLSMIERDFTVIKRFDGTLGNGTIFVCRSETTATFSLPQAELAHDEAPLISSETPWAIRVGSNRAR